MPRARGQRHQLSRNWQFQTICGAAVGEVFWQEAFTLSLGSKNVLAMSRTAVLIVWNALECCPSANVFFAARARAQGHGTFSQSAQTRDRQGNVGIRVV